MFIENTQLIDKKIQKPLKERKCGNNTHGKLNKNTLTNVAQRRK